MPALFAVDRFPSLALLSALIAFLSGCATAPDESPQARRGAGEKKTAADRGQPEVPERDRVLYDYRAAATALRTGRYDVAKSRLDDAIARIGGIIANDADAAKARSLFAAESSKTFIGEPYERVMAYYYRGILFWRDGEPDNARACFRSGQFLDSGTAEEKYQADYVLLDYLDGFVSTKLQADGSDALARAERFIASEPQKAQAILRTRLLLDQAYIDWLWPRYRYQLTLDQALLTTLESEARWARQENHVVASQSPNYLSFIHSAPLRRVQASAVSIAE